MSSGRNLVARALHKAARIIDPPPQVTYIEDEGATQLYFSIPGILEKGNLYSFEYAISHLPSSAPILEIGSYCGLSANLLAYFKRKHQVASPVITCDKWEFQKPANGSSTNGTPWPVSYKDWQRFARDSYIRNIKTFSGEDPPFTFEMTSDEFFTSWQNGESTRDILGREFALGGPLSFCFIDGNHAYNYVKRDFINCDAFLEPGGFILFDDSTLLKDDVYKVMPEVMATGRYKLTAMNPYHLFQKTAAQAS
jgi:methyltransferase family protein